MRIYDLYDIPSDAMQSVGGKAKGLYELSKCGLSIAKGFVAVDIDSEVALQAVLDHYESSGMETVARTFQRFFRGRRSIFERRTVYNRTWSAGKSAGKARHNQVP